MAKSALTIVIVARNAETTISRAIESARGQSNPTILLLDDASTDSTVRIAEKMNCDSIIRVSEVNHSTLGAARQLALENVETPFGMILDADDCLLTGRISRVLNAFQTQDADLVFDELELWDGSNNQFIRELLIPGFLSKPDGLVRLFERNYLPGIGQVSFRTEFLKSVGYDRHIHGPEDYDLILRCIVRGAKVRCLCGDIGYRMYAYPSSLSRDIKNQKQMVSRVLHKFKAEDIIKFYLQSGYSERIAFWALSLNSIFKGDYKAAIGYLDQAVPFGSDLYEILEKDGPEPYPEGWRYHFTKGTCLLLLNQLDEAEGHLRSSKIYRSLSAEQMNNLGVVFKLKGDLFRANQMFENSIEIYPEYLDAKLNLNDETRVEITTHSLRHFSSRSSYVPIHSETNNGSRSDA